MNLRNQIKQAVRECDDAEAAYQQELEKAKKLLAPLKERVRQANADLDRLLGRAPTDIEEPIVDVSETIRARGLPDLDKAGLRCGSRPYRLGELLQANPGTPYTGAEAAKELGFSKKEKTTLYSDLARLEEKGIAVKLGRGTWQAARLNGVAPQEPAEPKEKLLKPRRVKSIRKRVDPMDGFR